MSFEIFGDELIKYEGNDKIVVIPDDITSIRDFAFNGNEQIERVMLPEGLTSIGGFAFYECSNLRDVMIPDTVSYIGQGAFAWCASIESMVLPDTITSIANSLFFRCSNLREITLPSHITSVGHSAFSRCTSLKEINLPDTVKTIGDNAFEKCDSLQSIHMPKNIKEIGSKAFYHTPSLKELILPESLTTIADFALETHGPTHIIASENIHLKSRMFDVFYNRIYKRRNDESYAFRSSYLPNIDFNMFKPAARIILLTNFLETYDYYHDEYLESYTKRCEEYNEELLVDIIEHKNYEALNQGIEAHIFTCSSIEPYLDKIEDREEKAKLLEYKRKEKSTSSAFDDIENALLDLF